MDFSDPVRLPERRPVVRDAKGRVVSGALNAGGKPKRLFDLVRACRGAMPDIVRGWIEIANDTRARNADRIAAGSLVAAYGFGRPAASLTLDLGGNSELLEQRRQVQRTLALYAGARITFADETEQLEAADEDEEAEDDDNASAPAEDSGSSV